MSTSSTHHPVSAADQFPDSMRAVVQHEYGTADVLGVEDVPLPPAPGKGEVLIAVGAAGMDRGTWHLMAGEPRLVRPVVGWKRPRNPVPGLDVAGTVVAVGPDVDRLSVGDRVFGIARSSFAQYAVAKETKLSAVPAQLSDAQAAVLGVSGLTALQALRDSGQLQSGQRVLILGASGGVGTYAVQIAAAMGAQVTGVCSAAKADLVRSLGAVDVVDYRTADPVDGSTRYDLIVDIAGNRKLAHLRRALTPTGTLVIVGGENGGKWTGGIGRQLRAVLLSPFVGQRLRMVVAKEQAPDDLALLAQYAADGQVRPVLDSVVPLSGAADGMRRLVAGEVRGKVAIQVG